MAEFAAIRRGAPKAFSNGRHQSCHGECRHVLFNAFFYGRMVRIPPRGGWTIGEVRFLAACPLKRGARRINRFVLKPYVAGALVVSAKPPAGMPCRHVSAGNSAGARNHRRHYEYLGHCRRDNACRFRRYYGDVSVSCQLIASLVMKTKCLAPETSVSQVEAATAAMIDEACDRFVAQYLAIVLSDKSRAAKTTSSSV